MLVKDNTGYKEENQICIYLFLLILFYKEEVPCWS